MLSIVIPALNEAKQLPATLRSVLTQDGDFEVLLVDGGSHDRTRDIAAEFEGVRLVQTSAGRATQMNAGARLASGEMLLFLHADTLLPAGAVRTLNALEADAGCQFGGFHHQFSGKAWQFQLVSWLTNLRCKLSGVFYGDQAMFVRRSLFEAMGGFAEEPILEDMVFCEQALRHGRPTFLPDYVVTDSRKFEQMGVWRSLMRCLMIILCHQFRLPIKGQAFFSPVR